MTSNIYNKQIGGSHYKDMVVQPSEFINKNKLQFAEGNAINISADMRIKEKYKI